MRRAALIALLALAASACTIDVDIGIALGRSGEGTVTVDIATDAEFEQLFQLTGANFEGLVAARGAAAGLPFTVSAGEDTRYSATSGTLPPDRLARVFEDLVPGIGEVVITPGTRTLEFDASLMPLTIVSDVAPYFTEEDPGQFAEDVSVTLTLAMEGDIETSTATRVEGGSLVWEVPFSDASNRLLARSALESEGTSIPWTVIILALTFAVALGFLMAVRANLATGEGDLSPSGAAMRSAPPSQQAVAPRNTPPEDQPVAPPEEPGDY